MVGDTIHVECEVIEHRLASKGERGLVRFANKVVNQRGETVLEYNPLRLLKKAMIDHIDHIVLTTRDLKACIRFYCDVLGMKLEKFKTPTEERLALKFGAQKINLHEWGKEFTPRAHVAVPGSLDLCFIAAVPLDDVIEQAEEAEHPDHRRPGGEDRRARARCARSTCAIPDLNLVEISVYNN